MDKTIDRWTDPDGNGYAFKDTVARAQNREMINKISAETTDRKAEVNTERKRIDNLIASGTAQTQEIGKKIIQDSSISSSGIVLKGLTNNNYYYKLFEEFGSIDSEFCTITNQQGKYTAKLLKPGLYYMNFKVHVEMSGGFSEEVIAPLKLFKSNTLDWSTFDVLDAETVEVSKTENTSINKKIHFLYRITEPSYIRIYIDVNTSHTKTITFRIDSCDITALDWKGKQSADLSELHDLRIGADGTVYGTAGDAVREQFKNATKEIQNFEGATLNDAGARGLVPAPEEGMTQHVLTSVGTWEKFVAQWFDDGTGVRIGLGSSYSCDITQATGRKIGFMGADDKGKLDKYPSYDELEKTIQGLENKIDAMQQIITKLVTAPTLTADTNGNLQITEKEEG